MKDTSKTYELMRAFWTDTNPEGQNPWAKIVKDRSRELVQYLKERHSRDIIEFQFEGVDCSAMTAEDARRMLEKMWCDDKFIWSWFAYADLDSMERDYNMRWWKEHLHADYVEVDDFEDVQLLTETQG